MKKTMMKKYSFLHIAAALLTGITTASLTACTNDNAVEDISLPIAPQTEARTYTVSISATMNDGSMTRTVSFDNSGASPAINTTFADGEEVYVYDKTTAALLGGTLSPTSISADGKTCQLKGELTGTINADDEILLMYNLSSYIYPTIPIGDVAFDYKSQNGTENKCIDGATSTMKVLSTGSVGDGYTLSVYAVGDGTKQPVEATFTNVQSMFRFQFKDADTGVGINVKKLDIKSKRQALAGNYRPLLATPYDCSALITVTATPAISASEYVYLALCIDPDKAAADELTFMVTDESGNQYRGTKAAPAAGFQNGRYYYTTAPIALTKLTKVAPIITWTKPSTPVTPTEGSNDSYYYISNTGGIDITLSNPAGKTCYGYTFSLGNDGTVNLNGIDATLWNSTERFITSWSTNLTLNISGANSINFPSSDYGIYVFNSSTSQGNLKLSGNGVLTVTSASPDYCGLRGYTNYKPENNNHATTTETDVSTQLAASKYKVTRSARTDNGDGTYTWTYTVTIANPATSKTLAELTDSEIGWRIGSDGKAYDRTGTLPTGVSAVAMVAYIGTAPAGGTGAATCTHGLAIGLEQLGYGLPHHWDEASTYVTTWADSHVISGATWRLPTVDDWKYMCQGCSGATYSAVMEIVTYCDYGNLSTLWRGLTGHYPSFFWTATECSDPVKAYCYSFDTKRFDEFPKAEGSSYILPVLAF